MIGLFCRMGNGLRRNLWPDYLRLSQMAYFSECGQVLTTNKLRQILILSGGLDAQTALCYFDVSYLSWSDPMNSVKYM
jgi:hypothetical protein